MRSSVTSTATPNPLLWLALFVTLSIGATVANNWHLLDVPRQVAGRITAPLQAGVSRVGRAVGDVASGWQEISRLRRENQALRRTVDELVQETVSLRAAALENRDLREQLHYAREHQSKALLPADVIGFDSSTLVGHAVLDQGTDGRLAAGMPVVSTAGLVGRIVATTPRTSTVLLITHPSSKVNAVIQGTPGATGIVSGLPDGRLLMRHIPQSEPVQVNDIVVTSGLGGVYPRDLAIGRVARIDGRDVDVFQQAIVEPFVNVRKLSHVLVVSGFAPAKL